jgi:hypothetical protein
LGMAEIEWFYGCIWLGDASLFCEGGGR